MPNDDTFAKRLKRLRKKVGLTQEELAHKSELSIMTIRRWEWGERSPRLEEIKKIADILHVSEDELLNGASTERWVLHVEIGNTKEDFIDLKQLASKPICSIITDRDAGFLRIGGSYELWTDDALFKKIEKDLKKFRATVIQNGKALGGIKD